MFEVTEKATEMIREFLKDREEIPPIRIVLSQGGWAGPSLGMALDEPRENDEVFDSDGITYVIDKGLLDQVKPIKVDFVDSAFGSGFSIQSNLAMGASCGSCCSC